MHEALDGGSQRAPARVLAIFGPTAAGKSALAHAAACALGGEIIVADPFQRYRGLEVAADSPRAAERAEVVYHLVGDLYLDAASSAGSFARLAHEAIDHALARGRTPVVTGGTGLYLRAALGELGFPPTVESRLRREVEELVEDDPNAAVDELERRDPAAAARVDLRNPRRLARALELARAGGGSAPAPAPARPRDRLWSPSTRHPTLLVGITRPPAVLDRLIAARVRRELDEGLEAEIEAALDRPEGMSREAAQIIGVAELRAIRAGQLGRDALEATLATRTRRLARKQLAWMRKTPAVAPLDLGEAPASAALPRLLALWEAVGGRMAGDGDSARRLD